MSTEHGDLRARFRRARSELAKVAVTALCLTGAGVLFDAGGSPLFTALLVAAVTALVARYAFRFSLTLGGISPERLPRHFIPVLITVFSVVCAVVAGFVDYSVVIR